MIKGLINQDNAKVQNVYVFNIKDTQNIRLKKKRKKAQGTIDKSSVIVGNFNISLSVIEGTNGRKNGNDIEYHST